MDNCDIWHSYETLFLEHLPNYLPHLKILFRFKFSSSPHNQIQLFWNILLLLLLLLLLDSAFSWKCQVCCQILYQFQFPLSQPWTLLRKYILWVGHSSNQLHPKEQWDRSDQSPENLYIVKRTLLRSLLTLFSGFLGSAIYGNGIFAFQRDAFGNEYVSTNYSCQKLGIHQASS